MYRNRKLLDLVRESPCQICGAQDGTVVAAHSNQQKDGKGMGLKAHDYRIAALCFSCHANIDHPKLMLACGIAGAVGKFVTNFFTDETP